MTELIGDIKYAIGLDFLLEGGDNWSVSQFLSVR